LRGTMKSIADGKHYKVPATIDDPAILEEIEAALQRLGYAKAAELNHYPGPRHVLDLAAELELTPEQIGRSKAIFESMQAQAAALGRQFVEQEQALDRAFADGSIDTELLRALVSDLGDLQARIRYTHLVAHLEQKAVLTHHQVQLYDRLRGYGAGQSHQPDHAH